MKQLSTKDPIVIGDTQIDPIDYAIRANANLGIKETGKSATAGYFAEQLMKRGIPIVVISPSPGRVWRHLKIGRPGFEGFPVVVVGDDEDADLRIHKDTAADIMRAAMQEGISVVFDVFSKNLTKADFRGIVAAVCKVLLFENENYGLRHLFLEEAGDLVPQRIYDTVTYSAVEQLITKGGNSGIGVTILNPRAEGVNKEALELCQQLFLFKQTGKNSIDNLGKWLKNVDAENRIEVARSLSKLTPGQCWFWNADAQAPVLLQMPLKDTVHPDRRQLVGKSVITKYGTDVTQFVSRMTVALAKQSPVLKETGRQPLRIEEQRDNTLVLQLREETQRQAEKIQELTDELRTANQMVFERDSKLETVREMLRPDYERMQMIFEQVDVVPSGNGNSQKWDIWMSKLVGKQKDILAILIDRKRLTKVQLGLLVGMSTNSGTYERYLSKLVSLGLIARDGKELVLREIS